jgi:hypothetical protein
VLLCGGAQVRVIVVVCALGDIDMAEGKSAARGTVFEVR